MSAPLVQAGSLRRRLLLQLLCVAALLSTIMYFSVRAVANTAAEATHNNILAASATAIIEQLRSTGEDISIDIPYSAFSMLGSISDDQVFYRIESAGNTLTGYDDLPMPPVAPSGDSPQFYNAEYGRFSIRATAVQRVVPVNSRPVSVLVIVAQTRLGQDAITGSVARTAALLGVGFFLVTGLLSWFATQNTFKPLRTVAEKLQRRGAHDLRPLTQPVPRELQALVESLNSFMARLRSTLRRTETFIADAAHHVRTPLAVVRTQSEIALRRTQNDDTRQTLRTVIRAVDESSRSATQLLEHAMVSYRSDQVSHSQFDMSTMLGEVVSTHHATADLKEIQIKLSMLPDVQLHGDRVLIESAVHNLLDNAIKYSDAGGTIDIELSVQQAQCLLCICDHGRGLAGQSQSTLTERFHRGKNVDDVVGSGLGLTIVEEVVLLHTGNFELKPNTGGGTCAHLLLPLH